MFRISLRNKVINHEVRRRNRVSDVISPVAESKWIVARTVKNEPSVLYFCNPEKQRQVEVGIKGAG